MSAKHKITPRTNKRRKQTQLAARTPTITRSLTFDLDVKPTHGQRASYRAWSMSVHDGIIRIRGLEGERLTVAFNALGPNILYIYTYIYIYIYIYIFVPSERR